MSTATARSVLATEIGQEFTRYFRHLAGRVERAVRSLPLENLWVKPYPYGNSVGHLVLHLTGNLNHYVGAGMANTGYVRDRPKEFTDPTQYPPEEVLKRFHEALELVVQTIQSLDDKGLMAPAPNETPIQTRFGLLMVCAAHLNNHIGQMSYLVQAQGHSTAEAPIW
jgi:uncharacterized damage-inducible protein DinB